MAGIFQIVPFLMCGVRLFIGGLKFAIRLEGQTDIYIDEEIRPFLDVNDSSQPDVTVDFIPDERIPEWEIDLSDASSHLTIRYAPKRQYRFDGIRGCFIYMPMEEILLRHGRFFLHASFISSPWGGILFTGDSGAGKSTQAELWKRYMRSTVINGDRAIVAKEADGWRAYGSPYAGSSGYYVRKDEAIRAIILPEKSGINEVTSVPPSEAFQKLFLQVSLDHTKPDQVNRLCDLLSEMIAAVPVYRLRCTPDERAVETLKNVLEADASKDNTKDSCNEGVWQYLPDDSR